MGEIVLIKATRTDNTTLGDESGSGDTVSGSKAVSSNFASNDEQKLSDAGKKKVRNTLHTYPCVKLGCRK